MATGLENLRIYKLAVRLEKFVHRVVNEKFPADEKYRSADQLKRSSSSVADNIAESYGRYHFKDKRRCIYIARGEAEETKSKTLFYMERDFCANELLAEFQILNFKFQINFE